MSAPGKPVSNICRMGRTNRERSDHAGFSLLELILVLAIAGMMAAFVVPSLPGALESARLRGSAGEVRATLALARALAVSDGRNRRVVFDLSRGEYGVEGEKRVRLLPEGIRMAVARPEEVTPAGENLKIRFYPDGSADEAEVSLVSSGGVTMRIRVDPLTGIARAGI